jgi:hypothetical protein
MDSQHSVEAWLGEINRRPRVFNHNPRLVATEFKGFELANEVTMVNSRGAVEHVYMFAKKGAGDEALLRVSICDHDSAQHALIGLREVLDNMMNPDIPRATGKLGKATDIGFAMPGERGEGLGAAVFSIGNVSITVHSAGPKPLNVTTAALHVSKLLSAAPDKAAISAERVVPFSPAPVQLGAGEVLTLIEELPEDRPDANRIQVIAPDGELRREGRSLVYVGRDDGPQRISLFTHTQRIG